MPPNMNPFEPDQPHDASQAYRPSPGGQRSSTQAPQQHPTSSRPPQPFLGSYPTYTGSGNPQGSAGNSAGPPQPPTTQHQQQQQQPRGGVSFQMPPPRSQPQRAPNSRDSVKQELLGGSDKYSPGETPGSRGVPELLSGGGSSGGAGSNLDPEAGFSNNNNFKRKKSLVRPDRERMDPNHRQWYYRNHAAQLDMVDASGRPSHHIGYMPSTTGHLPQHGAAFPGYGINHMQGPGGGISGLGMVQPADAGRPNNMPPGGLGRAPPPGAPGLRRGKSILGREEDQVETGINFLKRGVSLKRTKSQASGHRKELPRDWAAAGQEKPSRMANIAPGPVGPWMIYCYALTICCVGPCLGIFGIKTPEQQRAWREKIGLLSIIVTAMAGVGFITFGFTQAVCDTAQTRYEVTNIDNGSMVFYGYDYDLNNFYHPQVGSFAAGTEWQQLNPVYSEPFSSGKQDGSLIAQRTGGACTGLILNSGDKSEATQYFPCQMTYLNGTRAYRNATMCHSADSANKILLGQAGFPLGGPVYYTWEQVEDKTRNFLVWKGAVIDAGRLALLYTNNLTYPALFDTLKTRSEQWSGRDVTAAVFRSQQDTVFDCLDQIARVGFVDSESIGCVASQVELYVALVVILGVVGIKFIMAVIFGWFLSWRLGNYGNESRAQRKKRAAEIEDWSDNIYRPAPAAYRPNVRKHRSFLPKTSRFSTAAPLKNLPPRAAYSEKGGNGSSGARSPAPRGGRVGVGSPVGGSPPGSPSLRGVRSSTSLVNTVNNADRMMPSFSHGSRRSSMSHDPMIGAMGACPWPLDNVVPQPPSDYMPYHFPLAYSLCLVTAYSESFEGLRTTLDSLATTDYPNSHKVILVIADGIVKGAGSELSTPDICLSMMKDFITPPEEVEGNSYVAIADGYKRHNMAKVYAGFYEYDDETVERSKQQRIPMVLVAKCGSPLEADGAKPGNRGKRDSQVLLMAFLQKVMFDERMTAFEYDFFNALWRVTGVSPDHYEIILMVDADTKVFPDSLTRMVACMVEDPEIMGLCGETKIANKSETWVTMIQVFEYYISHHQTKAFEACFGGVTCLPGCFSAYRIKAPKGAAGYWVPILANPDIVEHYSENVVDTLHKKNLLLLGEDRFLTTLMLKTFPKRKMMFVPQAVCKTVVPDTFRVLLSQRRRWINSTVHNLAELVMVNDLCGTFCFSMRFVVFMELSGTLVLPAAIAFTLYVVVSAVVDGIQGKPIQSIPLILLALILGLPGILIIVTSRKIAYVGWMGVYLISLPIWNFVLPAYAFWHMDDFSWGATRIVQGDAKGDHGDAEGKFDPSNIVMKRWVEFERDRRLAAGIQSRDSTYDVLHIGSPDRQAGSSRYSFVSSSVTGHSEGGPNGGQTERLLSSLGSHSAAMESESGHGRVVSGGIPGARARMDAVPLLSLPAPLGDPGGANKGIPAAQGSVFVTRPTRDTSPTPLSNRQQYELFSNVMDEEHQPMMAHGANGSNRSSPDQDQRRPMHEINRADIAAHLNSDSEHRSSYGAPPMPPSLSGHGASRPRENAPRELTAPSQDAFVSSPSSYAPSSQSSHQRGFSLVDDGPTGAAPRVVQRGARRTSTADNGGPGGPTSASGAGSRFSRSTAADHGNGSVPASSAGGHSSNPFHR